MPYRNMSVRPISGALGAEIDGVDLSGTLNDDIISEVRRALHENLVVFFHDQVLTPDQHMAFALCFGELETHRYAAGLPSHPEILPIIKEANDGAANFGGIWHSDTTFHEAPPLGSVLYALDVPDSGGDTLFANMYAAYDALSDGMKQMLDGMSAMHSGARSYGSTDSQVTLRRDKGSRSMKVGVKADADSEVEHPVVRTHPEIGRKSLFVSPIATQRFKDMTHAESLPILDFLSAHARRPEFTCRFRWRTNDIAFWDNRCTQHYALNDYHGHRREMHRVTITGDRPV
jgi:taurine dioxygenase